MKRIASIKFGASGQMELFTCEDPFLQTGGFALVDAGQGVYMGKVMRFHETCPEGVEWENVPEITRVASREDMEADTENRELLFRAKRFCDQRIRERKLDMKLVDVEALFDRSKLIFYFTAPTRIDFRELVKDLVREYHTRIELRQIGVRHETQMLGALGSCGMTCCCRRFLRKFMPVTIKMAKEQNLFLNPTKISGICGRLLCCLSYEQENYDIFHRSCPRLGKRYQTSRGPVKVLRANLFRNSVAVLTEQNEELEFTLDEWKELEPRRPDAPPHTGNAPTRGETPRQAQSEGLMVIEADPDSLDLVDDDPLYGDDATLDDQSGALGANGTGEEMPDAGGADGGGSADEAGQESGEPRKQPHRHKRKRKK